MTRIWLLVMILFLGFSGRLSAFAGDPVRVREFSIRENDTLTYTLKLALNEAGEPAYFFRNVFTPVCLTGECKPVYINFYWDLLGNYTRFDFPSGQILTKMDHREFRQEDYDKLQDILSNQSSLLKDVAMDDLVGKGTENLADSVDAKAGATLKTVKNEVIDGAVYTCYTLWHLAHGKVVGEMQKITETYRTEPLLHRFLTSDNHHYQYWAMERVIDANGKAGRAFAPDLMQIMRGKNIFAARYALQKLNGSFFAEAPRQLWLWETYQKGGYSLQNTILKKLASLPLTDALLDRTTSAMAGMNQEQFTLVLNAVEAQLKLSDKTAQKLARHLEHTNPDYSAAVYKVLTHFEPKNQEVRTKLSAYKTKSTQTETLK
ncbi:hypothetical protein [Tellurirhabdus bombi]|uniref:hypothetical protein n=1 Tax=Tellurirhabdus bombi TaxID=2907205 RepID=UPI001F28C1A5|nr:hypothetical protein [Tellurirhabdus bombi]